MRRVPFVLPHDMRFELSCIYCKFFGEGAILVS
jgi:hypothetical protein